MCQDNYTTDNRKGKHLTYDGFCQPFVGAISSKEEIVYKF